MQKFKILLHTQSFKCIKYGIILVSEILFLDRGFLRELEEISPPTLGKYQYMIYIIRG